MACIRRRKRATKGSFWCKTLNTVVCIQLYENRVQDSNNLTGNTRDKRRDKETST